ncbi:MAG TPA: aminoacyl-tRNA hydrolase [Sutterellaceae bacterium]|nr:aminoacyl-tRNA hydrolase [Sutterellaceae bacterium]
MPAIRLIVGLGNPGIDYADTRHNAGFWFLDQLAQREKVFFHEEKKFQGEVARVRLAGQDIWLLKPTTFMNRSGQAVVALALYYKILPEEILVVHDELDLMPGCMKLKKGGGNAGHNGLKDITEKLSTPNFWRLRLGTGHPRSLGMAQPVADFVLHAPSSEHKEMIQECIAAALKTTNDIACGDMARVQRSLAKYGSPKPKTNLEKNEEQ